MGFFYVDDIGTGGAEYVSAQSGSMAALGAANIYPDYLSAKTAGAADDDIICISNNNSFVGSDNIIIRGGVSMPMILISVDPLNIDTYSPGASISTNLFGDDIVLYDLLTIIGFNITSEDIIQVAFTGDLITFVDSTIKLNASGNYIEIKGDSGNLEFIDSVIDLNYNNNYFFIYGGGKLILNGGSVINTTAGTGNQLTNVGFDSGGGMVRAIGTDLSTIDEYLINNVGSSLTSDDMIDVHIDKCKLNSSLINFHEETFKHKSHTILVTQSSSNSADAEYQYYQHARGGTVQDQDDSGIHCDESTAYLLSDKKASVYCLTNSDASTGIPFQFKFPTRVAGLSATVSKVILYFASTEALDDSKIYAKMVYPDRTNPNEFITINSLVTPANVPENPLRTPAAYPDGSATRTWKDGVSDLTGYNEYYLELDTSADPGGDCVPVIIMYVTEPSIGIYFDTSIDVVAS